MSGVGASRFQTAPLFRPLPHFTIIHMYILSCKYVYCQPWRVVDSPISGTTKPVAVSYRRTKRGRFAFVKARGGDETRSKLKGLFRSVLFHLAGKLGRRTSCQRFLIEHCRWATLHEPPSGPLTIRRVERAP